MVIVQLDHFPNVCRLCIQPKPPDQLIPIESSTLEHGNQTLADLLNDLTSVVIPKVMKNLKLMQDSISKDFICFVGCC